MAKKLLIGKSSEHRQLVDKLTRIAATDAEVLISGPSGVGKELYARYVHENSPRNKARFVPINCGALPADLLENELFGHVGGAFTGAKPQTEGLVAAAEGGTLFFDEVDSLALMCQVKLLRFLQEKEYRRLGETRIRRTNVRIIAATNTDLFAAVRAGRFREDLFFRLRIAPIEVPALRDRPGDIPLLLNTFIAHYAEAYRLPQITLSRAVLKRLKSYPWPGNIRELENCVKYLTCLQLNRAVELLDLPLLEIEKVAREPTRRTSGDSDIDTDGPDTEADLDLTARPYNEVKRDLVHDLEREYVGEALRRSGGNIAEAARQSKKPRRVFFEMMRRHGITVENLRPVRDS